MCTSPLTLPLPLTLTLALNLSLSLSLILPLPPPLTGAARREQLCNSAGRAAAVGGLPPLAPPRRARRDLPHARGEGDVGEM